MEVRICPAAKASNRRYEENSISGREKHVIMLTHPAGRIGSVGRFDWGKAGAGRSCVGFRSATAPTRKDLESLKRAETNKRRGEEENRSSMN